MIQNVMPVAFLSCAKAHRRSRRLAVVRDRQYYYWSKTIVFRPAAFVFYIYYHYTPERGDTGRETNETAVDRRATTANHLFRSIIITHTLVYTYIAARRARPDRFPIDNRKSYYTRYIINTATVDRIDFEGGCTVRRPCTIFLGPLRNIKNRRFPKASSPALKAYINPTFLRRGE